ncbi:hypothetical protein K432DRAFT_403809 [Lepidopterella palustris CBS 459.81]|uniref:Uncharacterized protein n=1 Tax=Lepidopterella palustris CBS 459.81 TaxID=1314670 RepID=A0A8E2JG75_9PEZI|nr:hypothetical protein K432DRAFT_403809 [Lepidopterella palustris CBS 459.81]
MAEPLAEPLAERKHFTTLAELWRMHTQHTHTHTYVSDPQKECFGAVDGVLEILEMLDARGAAGRALVVDATHPSTPSPESLYEIMVFFTRDAQNSKTMMAPQSQYLGIFSQYFFSLRHRRNNKGAGSNFAPIVIMLRSTDSRTVFVLDRISKAKIARAAQLSVPDRPRPSPCLSSSAPPAARRRLFGIKRGRIDRVMVLDPG